VCADADGVWVTEHLPDTGEGRGWPVGPAAQGIYSRCELGFGEKDATHRCGGSGVDNSWKWKNGVKFVHVASLHRALTI
jgi:hypothetical protein